MQDARNFSYSTDYPSPFVVYKGNFPIKSLGRGSTTTKVEHKLGFTPLIVGLWSETEDFAVAHDLASGESPLYVFADDTYIYCNVLSSHDAFTWYVRIIGFANPDHEGDSGVISSNATFNFSTDNDYIGCIQGSTDQAYVMHSLGYTPQSQVWVVGDNFVYTGNYPDGSGSSRTTAHNTIMPEASFISLRKDGRYELLNATPIGALGFAAYYNPSTGTIDPKSTFTPTKHY
jgi:hypothetical protein